MAGPMQWKTPKPWRSAKYRQFVSSLRCCVSGAEGPNDPHHHQKQGDGKMGGKIGDERCVPLRHESHNRLHNHGRKLWEAWRVDPEQIIRETQEAWFAKFHSRPWLDNR